MTTTPASAKDGDDSPANWTETSAKTNSHLRRCALTPRRGSLLARRPRHGAGSNKLNFAASKGGRLTGVFRSDEWIRFGRFEGRCTGNTVVSSTCTSALVRLHDAS